MEKDCIVIPGWLNTNEDSNIVFKKKLDELEAEKEKVKNEYKAYLDNKFSYLFNKKVRVKVLGNQEETTYIVGFKEPRGSYIEPIYMYPKKDGSISQRPMYVSSFFHTEQEMIDKITIIDD